MIDPYTFIRVVTITLGVIWASLALVRIVRLARQWVDRFRFLGYEERWWRRQLAVACLRTTVLDPINLLLLGSLGALWLI